MLQVERVLEHGDRLCGVLTDPAWLGPTIVAPGDRLDLRRIETDLTIGLSGTGPARVLRKAAYVDLGPLRRTVDGCTIEVSWRAASLAPLFPVFAGVLKATADRASLRGAYAPPGGEVGLLFDRTFLRLVATRTAAAFLERIVARAASRDLPVSRPGRMSRACSPDRR